MTRTEEEPVLTRVGPGRWTLILNRPERLNAFNAELAALLLDRLEAAQRDPECRVVILTGAGRAFSAGQDLEERRDIATNPVDLGASLAAKWHPLLRLVVTGKPVIAAVNGLAAGAACNLALAADITIAARGASFRQPFARIGLAIDCGGAFTLPRLVGDQRARGLAFLGEPVSAEAAERMGLIWQVVDDDALTAAVDAAAARLISASPLGLAATKRLMRSDLRVLDATLASEATEQRALGASRDYAEGVNAFFDKRSPRFEGR